MLIFQIKKHLKLTCIIVVSLMVASCGGSDGNSDSGAEQNQTESQTTAEQAPSSATETAVAAADTAVIGPDLNGSDWVGYIKSEADGPENLTATITHVGNQIVIITTKTGVAHELIGTINAQGGVIKMTDTFDGEDWTTLFGNISKNSINLADYVVREGRVVDTNILILKR